MKACSDLGIKQVFISRSNSKGNNANTARVIRTLYDQNHPFDLQKALEKWIDNYNQDFPHQGLCYRTLYQYYKYYVKNKEQVLTQNAPVNSGYCTRLIAESISDYYKIYGVMCDLAKNIVANNSAR